MAGGPALTCTQWSLLWGKSREPRTPAPKDPSHRGPARKHHRKKGNSTSAAEVMLALINYLGSQLMLKGTFFAITELVLFLAELRQ